MGKVSDLVFKHYTKLPYNPNQKLPTHVCNYCEKKYAEHVSRQEKHLLLECKKCPVDVRKYLQMRGNSKQCNLKRAIDLVSQTESENDEPNHNIPSTSENQSATSIISGSKFQSVRPFLDAMPSEDNKSLHDLMAKAIYASGTPLQITENVYWQEFFSKLRPCYQLPSRYQLSNSLLDKVYNDIETKVENKITKSLTVGMQCDGWSNIRNEGIINFILTTPDPVFYKTLPSATHRQTAQFMADEMARVIEEVGIKKVLGVVTDNENKMKAAWEILEEKYEETFEIIYFYGCLSHVLHLLVKDILDQQSADKIIKACVSVVKEIKNSHVLGSLFSSIQKKNLFDPENLQIVNKKSSMISLKLFGKTRWGLSLMCLESMKFNEKNLKELAIHPQSTLKQMTRTMILENSFWDSVSKLIVYIKPINVAIMEAQSDKSTLSQVPNIFKQITDHFENQNNQTIFPLLNACEINRMNTQLTLRKEMTLRPIHFAANIVDTFINGKDLTGDQDLKGQIVIQDVAKKLGFDRNVVLRELAELRTETGIWGTEIVKNSLKCLSSTLWWKSTCQSTLLSKVASEILNLPCTSAATERSFSTYGWIHNSKRNRLDTVRAGKITYVAHNLRIFKSDSSHGVECSENVIDSTEDENDLMQINFNESDTESENVN